MSSWTPHLFERAGRDQDIGDELLRLLLDAGNQLDCRQHPVIFTLRHLSSICNVSYEYLRQIVSRRGEEHYRFFRIRKKTKGYRTISVPESRLMAVQRWIHRNVLLDQQASQISTAYSPGKGVVENARRHCGARWLVKIDVRRFFESISERQVYHVFHDMGYSPLLSFEMARICTHASSGRNWKKKRWHHERADYTIAKYSSSVLGHLPQGAPTSPMLANLICKSLDNEIADVARQYGGRVTRYADDIVFSASEYDRQKAVEFIRDVSKMLGNYGFRRNDNKTTVTPPGARRIVTGLLVDSDHPRLTKKFRDRLRQHLYYAKKLGIRRHCERRGFDSLLGFRNYLSGLISYASQVDASFAETCRRSFSEIEWGHVASL